MGFTNVDGLPHNTCRCLALLPSGDVWIGTDRGLALLDTRRNLILPYTNVEDSVLSLALNGDTLVVGRSTDVYFILMRGTPTTFDDDLIRIPDSLADHGAQTLCWFEGRLWLGSSNDGLRCYEPASGNFFKVVSLP